MTTEIIIKKMHNIIGDNPSRLTFGGVREQMSRDLLSNLTEVINRKSDYPKPYWLMVYANIDMGVPGGKVIKERIIILPQAPDTKYIGSLLFRIDNKNADAEMVWNLPLDIPTPGILYTEPGKNFKPAGSVTIAESAKGVPIFNRRLS